MLDQELDAPVRGRLTRLERRAQPADFGRALAALIATTRREWASPLPDAPPAAKCSVTHLRFAHPLIRFALDARRGNSWRARIGRLAWIQSVVEPAEMDQTPEGTS
jgi:hypothetical protein